MADNGDSPTFLESWAPIREELRIIREVAWSAFWSEIVWEAALVAFATAIGFLVAPQVGQSVWIVALVSFAGTLAALVIGHVTRAAWQASARRLRGIHEEIQLLGNELDRYVSEIINNHERAARSTTREARPAMDVHRCLKIMAKEMLAGMPSHSFQARCALMYFGKSFPTDVIHEASEEEKNVLTYCNAFRGAIQEARIATMNFHPRGTVKLTRFGHYYCTKVLSIELPPWIERERSWLFG